jgi:hypothetical protein
VSGNGIESRHHTLVWLSIRGPAQKGERFAGIGVVQSTIARAAGG